MAAINLATDLLRAFVTVVDLGSYTKAGNALGRTQPTISLQIRRLEELVEEKLIVQNGRVSNLTEAGETLAAYARQILHLNDEAVSRFRRIDANGPIKIGLPTDFAVVFLQDAITRFAVENPGVEVEFYCGLSHHLLEQLHQDKINLAVALIAEGSQQYLVRAWEERPVWAAVKGFDLDPKERVPLVCHPEGCEYRRRMVEALQIAEREWRIAYTSPNIGGLQNAVVSGLGVSALTRPTLTEGMCVLTKKDGFPQLRKIHIGLFYKLPRLSRTGVLLSHHVMTKLDEATDRHFKVSALP